MDPEPPIPALGHHRLLRELPDDAIDALVGVRRSRRQGRRCCWPSLVILGGALGRSADGVRGRYEELDAEFADARDPALR